MILSPVQCRMARAALGLGVRELAAAAKVSIDTVARFERGDELKERTIEALQRTPNQPVSSSPMAISLASALPGSAARSAEAAAASKPSAATKTVRGQDCQCAQEKTIDTGFERGLVGCSQCSDGDLELAAVEFIDENGGGPGVRLAKRQRAKQSN